MKKRPSYGIPHEDARSICGAKTQPDGTPCRSPPEPGRSRCRLHGGAPGSGPPLGNKNAYKNGMHTAEMKAERKRIRTLISDSLDFLSQLGDFY